MSGRQSRSASIPVPAARNIENVISIPFNTAPSPSSIGTSRPRLISNTRPLSFVSSDRGAMATTSARSNVATSPVRSTGSYSSIVARPIVGNNNTNHPPFEPRIIRATSTPVPNTNTSDPACFPSSTSPPAARIRRPSSTRRQVAPFSGTTTHATVPTSASAPAPGSTFFHSSHQAFPRPAYLDHSAFRNLIRTNATAPVQSADPPHIQHVVSGTTLTASTHPYLRGRALSPSDDSDEDSNVSRPSPPPVTTASVKKGIWSGKATFPLPTRWSEMDRHPSLSISSDGRDLTFSGPSCVGDKDSAAARANEPIPPACGIYYYEVEILQKGTKGHISIGFSCNDVRLSRLPGWEKHSWGYHADDGWSFPGHKEGNAYGPTFDSGDIIGCGVDFSQNRAFYTKNGTFLGMVFENVGVDLEVYPSVGLRHSGESIRVNFGHAPFKFAIEDFVHSVRDRVWSSIQSVPINWDVLRGGNASQDEKEDVKKVMVENGDDAAKEPLKKLVYDYLAHHGYLRTAQAFKAQCGGSSATVPERSVPSHLADEMDMDDGAPGSSSLSGYDEEYDLRTRVSVMNAVLTGNVDDALEKTRVHYPTVLEREQGLILFKLRCRKFVELILEASEALKKAKTPDPPSDAGEGERGREVTKKVPEIAREQDEDIPTGEMDDEGAMDVDDPSLEAHAQSSTSPSLGGSGGKGIPTATATATAISRSRSSSSTTSSSSSSRTSSKAIAKAALDEALKYGQMLDADYKQDTRLEIKTHLKRTFGVVAYPDPLAAGGEVAEMAGQEARVKLATELNQAILESQGKPAHPALEMLYRQASACVAELATQGVGAAAFADMQREFLEG